MTEYRKMIDHYRNLLGLSLKLKPVDINRVSALMENYALTDTEARAVYTVVYFHLKMNTRMPHERIVTVAYTVAEGVRMLGQGMDRNKVQLEIIALPSKFHEQEAEIVNIADVALDYLDTLIGTAQTAIKQMVTA